MTDMANTTQRTQQYPPLNRCANCNRWTLPGLLSRNHLCPQCVAQWVKDHFS